MEKKTSALITPIQPLPRTNYFLSFFLGWRIPSLIIALGGADFEIVSTNKIPPVRRLISFSPTCALLLVWQASPDLEGAVGELGGDGSSPLSACIAFQRAAKDISLKLSPQVGLAVQFREISFAALFQDWRGSANGTNSAKQN